jgi:hypothetical protein
MFLGQWVSGEITRKSTTQEGEVYWVEISGKWYSYNLSESNHGTVWKNVS